jgi:DNA-binding SARP family transcriptional activator
MPGGPFLRHDITTSPAVSPARAPYQPVTRLRGAEVELCIRLLSTFELARNGAAVLLLPSVQRLVAFVAIQERPVLRQYVAGSLWPETSDRRAGANLRSALWRLNQQDCPLIETVESSLLRLAPHVLLDLRDRTAEAQRFLADETLDLDVLAGSRFSVDLLPDWYDDWLVIERERFHQLRLRALERACERLTERGQFAKALQAGLAAAAAEPLRESAHRSIIKVHLAEGNRAEAVRHFELYRSRLDEQLGLRPSWQMLDLLARDPV